MPEEPVKLSSELKFDLFLLNSSLFISHLFNSLLVVYLTTLLIPEIT
jgi:hypothetical protein